MKSILTTCRTTQNLLHILRQSVQANPIKPVYVKSMLYHHLELSNEQIPPPIEWYEETFPRLTELSHSLKNLDWIEGKLVDVSNNSTVVTGTQLHLKMQQFRTLAREFLGSPSVIKRVNKNIQAAMEVTTTKKSTPPNTVCFTNPSERVALNVSSLTTICNFLNISAQQRKVVRFTICPLVTRHQIWTNTLDEILNGLRTEMENTTHQSKQILIGRQIVCSCLSFLSQTTDGVNEGSCSWMSPKPKWASESSSTHKWGELYDMFKDLIDCLRDEEEEEEELGFYLSKLEAVKEGLVQIKDVLVDRNIGFKEVKHQENLVQKKLMKTLGHSSKCLFTLLQYYMYGTIRDLEVDVCGGVFGAGCGGGRKEEGEMCLYMGRIVSWDDDEGMMVRGGVRQLDRALGLFKFVWETAGMKEKLRLHGHLFCVGGKERTVRYRGNLFFVHAINL